MQPPDRHEMGAYEQQAAITKVLAHPVRLRILDMLRQEEQYGGHSVCSHRWVNSVPGQRPGCPHRG